MKTKVSMQSTSIVSRGESLSAIIAYFVPEYITNLLLYSMPIWLDSWFICTLHNTPLYTTLGVTNNLLHLLLKVADAFLIGTVVLAGKSNGKGVHKDAGATLSDAFWITTILGGLISVSLYFGAYWIYAWYGVADNVITAGVPFLRIRAVGIFLMFVYFAFIGFLRAIKDTKTPMYLFVFGSMIFVAIDYTLIFGKFGFAPMGLLGSAWASVVQYSVMLVAVFTYLVFSPVRRTYALKLTSVFKSLQGIKRLLQVSWPIMCDKAIMAIAYIWLGKMIATLGTNPLAAFCVVKDMERFALLPAIAFAPVITLIASNSWGQKDWAHILGSLKKIVIITAVLIGGTLAAMSYDPRSIILLFDKKGDFIDLASHAFPLLSLLAVFDLLQLILSGVLRGSGNVYTVMSVRFVVCFFYFIPLSWLLSQLQLQDQTLQFILIYGSFYIGSFLMSLMYMQKLRGDSWKHSTI